MHADDSAPLVWRSDANGAWTYVSDGWLGFTGRALQEQLDQGWSNAVHPDDRTLVRDTYADAFAVRRDFALVCRLRHHDGMYRWIRFMGTPRWNAHGAFLGFVGCALDVSQARNFLAGPADTLHDSTNPSDVPGRGNLPLDPNRFIGRAAELATLTQLFSTIRQVTLVGPGGVGKTRLAVRLGMLLKPRYPDGVWLVQLASLAQPDLVAQSIADVLHVPGSVDADPIK